MVLWISSQKCVLAVLEVVTFKASAPWTLAKKCFTKKLLLLSEMFNTTTVLWIEFINAVLELRKQVAFLGHYNINLHTSTFDLDSSLTQFTPFVFP